MAPERPGLEVATAEDEGEHARVVDTGRNPTRATARSAGVREARGEVVALHSDDLVPLPDYVASCLEFHASHASPGDVLVLPYVADEALAGNPLVTWLTNHRLLGCFPEAGTHAWPAFRLDSLLARRSLLRRFPRGSEEQDAAEVGRALTERLPLIVSVARRPQSKLIVAPTLREIVTRECLEARARRRARRRGPRARLARDFDVRIQRPEEYLVGGAVEFEALLSSARILEAESSVTGDGTESRVALERIYLTAVSHAVAAGACGRPEAIAASRS